MLPAPFDNLETNEDLRLHAAIWIGHFSSSSSISSASDTSCNGQNAAFSMIRVAAGINIHGRKTSLPYNDMYLLECRNFPTLQDDALATAKNLIMESLD